jgi:hypothetical protein
MVSGNTIRLIYFICYLNLSLLCLCDVPLSELYWEGNEPCSLPLGPFDFAYDREGNTYYQFSYTDQRIYTFNLGIYTK